MQAYIYNGGLYCRDCAKPLIAKHGTDEKRLDESEGVSGPYPDGGGESDSPSHCDKCGLFLENALTTDGAEYVADVIETYQRNGLGDPDTIRAWINRYRDYPEIARVLTEKEN